jgi:RNA polymerase sigma-70 factor (ECF subfamily)
MQLDDYRVGTDFQAWVSQITRNLARKELRRLSREAARLRDYRSMLQAVGAEEHLAQPNGEEMLDRLRECLRRLPPNQAHIVRQAYDSKTTWDELARLLGRTRNALRVLLHRIRRQLWQCLRQEVRV